MDTKNGYPSCQISFCVKKDELGRYIENSLMLNLRGDDPEACYRAYLDMRAKMEAPGQEVMSAPADENEKIIIGDRSDECPECGGKLIVRTAKRGNHAGQRFMGCNRYTLGCLYTKALA